MRRAAFGTHYCPEFTLRKPQRCQCAARQCRAAAFRCEKLCFHQGCTLGAPNAPVGPSLLDARPKGVASEGKVGESRGAGKPWCPCPFCLRRETPAIPLRPWNMADLACGGRPSERRKGIPSAERKSEKRRQLFWRQWRFSLYLTKKLPRRRLFSLKFRLHY